MNRGVFSGAPMMYCETYGVRIVICAAPRFSIRRTTSRSRACGFLQTSA
jgi:hypothetical protein